MRSKTRPSMAKLRGFHALLAAFLHIIDTSRLTEVLHENNRAIVRAASQASKAADYILGFLPEDQQSDVGDAPSNGRRAA